MKQFENQPPRWAMAWLRFLLHPEFQEEIEGDLLEKYQSDLQRHGYKAAQKRFYGALFSLLKPNLILNLNRYTMKPQNWLSLVLIAFVVVVASVAPFLPGPSNDFSHDISQFAQIIGYLGLAFIPFGLVWLFIEVRNKKGEKLNRWSNGYYPALLVLTPVFLFLPLQLFRAIYMGWTFHLLPLVIIFSVVAFIIYRIRKLKPKTEYKFNPAPFYIVFIPIIALCTSQFAVEQAAALSREKIIVKTQPLLAAIDQYKIAHGDYPEKLEILEGKYIPQIPTFHIMGIRAYQYEKYNGSFQLSFEQLWHWNTTEVVVYNASGQKSMKDNYENHPTNHKNWRYYMAD